MNKKDLSSKVLVSLLTMSCVYLGGTSALPMAEAQQYLNDYPNGTYDLNGTYNGGNQADIFRVIGDDVKFNGTGDVVMNVVNDNNTSGFGPSAINITASSRLNFDMNNHDLTINTPWLGISTDENATGSINNSKNFNMNVVGGNAIYLYKENSVLDIAANENIIISGEANDGRLITINNGARLNFKAGKDVVLNNHGDDVLRATGKGQIFIEAAGDISLKNTTYMGIEAFDAESLVALRATSGMVTIEAPQSVAMGASAGKIDIQAREISIKAGANTAVAAMNGGSIALKGKTFIDCTNVGSSSVRAINIKNNDSNFTADELHINASGTGTDVIGAAVSNSFFTVNNDAYITVKSTVTNELSNNVGIFVETNGDDYTKASAVFKGKTFIDLDAAVNNNLNAASKGIWVRRRNQPWLGEPTVTFKDDVVIADAAAGNRLLYGIYLEDGKVDMEKGFVMKDSTKNLENIYSVMANGGTVGINSSKTGLVQLQGNLMSNNGADININFSEAGSYLTGSSFMVNGGQVNLEFSNGTRWDVTADISDFQADSGSTVNNLKVDAGSIIDMTRGAEKLSVKNLSGTGGVFKMDVDVRSMESDQIFVTNDFSGRQALDIYQKDNYIPAVGSTEGIGLVLASVKGDGVFTAKDREGTLFRSHYDLANKASTAAGYDFDWYLKAITVDNETTSVKTIMSANALNYHTWRTENDKLLQRMGELRNNGEAAKGAWFRMQGSKIGRKGDFGFENKYTAYELGYDEVTKRTEDVTRYQGMALSYTDGNSSYSSGSGDNSSKAISFYNTEIGSKGHYLDVVLKISNMDNDFAVYDTNSNKITGDFNNTGVALSAEYGRKNALNNGWYVEPQAQFTLGYLGGDNYTASNGVEVSQSGIRSAVGRIGFNIGKEVGSKGIVYAKANLLHEFGGGYDVTMRDSSGRVAVSDSFNDTWFEYGIGAALQTGKNNHIYFDVERSSGSDFKKDWQWNAGARWTF